MDIKLVTGDITQVEVEVLVTAANRYLAGGGGVDGAVHAAAGPRLLQALHPLGECEPGQAVITPAFDLMPRVLHVVHAVGPRYGQDHPGADLLASAYRESLARCDEVGARSVAFPSISTGVYGYPLDEACGISVKTLRETETRVEECLLVAFDAQTFAAWESALGEAEAASADRR